MAGVNNTEYLGHCALLETEKKANELKYVVSRPSIPTRYDLLLHDLSSNKIYKAQVKYTNSFPKDREGVIRLSLRKHKKQYQRHEIDVIIVWLERIKKLLWIPPSLFHNKREIWIRIEKSKHYNNHVPSVWFEDYLW